MAHRRLVTLTVRRWLSLVRRCKWRKWVTTGRTACSSWTHTLCAWTHCSFTGESTTVPHLTPEQSSSVAVGFSDAKNTTVTMPNESPTNTDESLCLIKNQVTKTCMGNAGSYSIWVQYVTSAVFTLQRRNAVRIGTNPVASSKGSDNKTIRSSTEHRH